MATQRSFLIEIDGDADLGGGRLHGRIEHVAWGDRADFGSLDELLGFMSRALRPLDGSAPDDEWARCPLAS